jgi:hypothetical protein
VTQSTGTPGATNIVRVMVGLLASLLLCTPCTAQGPLTATLPEVPMPTVTARLGPFELSPNLIVKQVGFDDNVFNETTDPKRDYVIGISPELTIFSRMGLTQFAASGITDFTHYLKYASERSVTQTLRGRFDLSLGRFRPSIAGATNSSRERPNNEIDTRARRRETEVSARVGYELSPLAQIYGGAAHLGIDYQQGETFRGVALDQSLNRRLEQVQGGIRLSLTPLTTVVVDATVEHDRFVTTPGRDSSSRTAATEVIFGNEAIIRGRVKVGFEDFRPEDPLLAPYKGLITAAALSFRGVWLGRFDGSITRQVHYSYDELEGYYVGTGGQITYTQRVVGPLDVQVVWGASLEDYGRRVGLAARTDETHTYGGGIGLNRDRGSRLGVNYEYRNRDASAEVESYSRHRVFASYMYVY